MRTIETNHLWRVNDIDIFYTNETNGGGNGLGEDYFNAVDGIYPGRVFENALEWCSGPGFIGYAMLATGVCNRITFNDIHQPALDMAELTKSRNPKYTDRVQIYQGATIDKIPETEQFDLVIANPPHFMSRHDAAESLGFNQIGFNIAGHIEEILVDTNWNAHINFYNSIKKRLAPDGIILIQENQVGSKQRSFSFSKMVDNAGLKITREFNSLEHYTENSSQQIYYIEIVHK